MEKAQVVITKCKNVVNAEQAVRNCLNLLGWEKIKALIQPNAKVLIKPNICGAKRPESGATTNPEIVEALIKIVQELHGVPIIGDGPAWGTGGNYFKITRMDAVAQRYGVQLLNLNFDEIQECGLPEGKVFQTAKIAKTAMTADVIINVPVMKTSGACLFSGALKNMKGVLSGVEKHKPHIYGIHQGIVEVNRLIKPQLSVMDAIYGMEGEGPANGTPVNLGLILAAFDPVALDVVACQIMQFDIADIPYIQLAEQAGLGSTTVEIMGESIASVQRKCKPPQIYANRFLRSLVTILFRKVFPRLRRLSKIKFDKKKCSYCGMCETACPVHVITVDRARKTYNINHRDCIGCMCCHEVCPVGAPYMSKAVLRTMQRKFWGGRLGKAGLAEFEPVDESNKV